MSSPATQNIRQNLFLGNWNTEEIEKVLARCPHEALLPRAGTAPWREAAANPIVRKLLSPMRAMAERDAAEPLPPLTDELYASFRQTGIRLTFETVYFERRRRLARAAMSVLLSDDNDAWRERFLSSMLEKFEAVFEEASWALPAHVNWHNDDVSGKEPLQIDLFCAETANLMAEMLELFSEVIPVDLQERVRERLRKGIFENYLQRDFHWMEVTHNWNAVCHQGVVGAALAQVTEPGMLAAILDRMRTKLPHFLEGYGPDGGCSEGPGYWNYGFGWFTMLNERLEKRTGGELSLFEGDDHIRAIALYGPRTALSGGHLVNFSDGMASGGVNPALLAYLGERLGESDCRIAGEENYRRIEREGIAWNSERADVFHLVRQILRCPRELPAEGGAPKDCFLPDLAVVIARSRTQGRLWEFAAKGGNNAEHHNHNDCGSFLLNIDGRRLVTEIGAPEYVHDFFGPKRYEFLAARSRGHSVPLVNGFEQQAGAEFTSRMLACEIGDEEVIFSLDLTACYPAEARCRKLVRDFHWDKQAGLIRVEDSFELEGAGEIESAIICESPISAGDGEVSIENDGVALRIVPAPGTRYAGSEVCPYHGRLGEARSVNRLSFRPEKAVARGVVGVCLRV